MASIAAKMSESKDIGHPTKDEPAPSTGLMKTAETRATSEPPAGQKQDKREPGLPSGQQETPLRKNLSEEGKSLFLEAVNGGNVGGARPRKTLPTVPPPVARIESWSSDDYDPGYPW